VGGGRVIAILTGVLLAIALGASAQEIPADSACKPIAQRTQDLGCWIIVDAPVGRFGRDTTYWHLDSYPTRAAAEAVKGPRGSVVESLGKVWLLTIGEQSFRPSGGTHVADVGPLPIDAARSYSAMYMEAIFSPGMTSSTHTHSGPEAWYTEQGEMCLETPDGITRGKAGGPPVIVRGGPPMHLTATGAVERRALVLVLHDSSKPPITIEHAWRPKGLCGMPGPPNADPFASYPLAAPDVQQFVRMALMDRVRANDVPDLNLLHASHRIAVRDVMPTAHLALNESALPQLDPYHFFLLSPADAQAVADRRKQTMPFLTVDQPSIDGDTATVWLGVDIAAPADPNMIRLCCCTGRAEFRRSGGGWAFVKWLVTICS
jgi:quercetin dioxygenase-like cupin family protein